LKVAYVSVSGAQTPLFMADAIGAFKQQNLNVDIQFIEANVAVKALIAKEVDVILQAAAAVLTADLNGNADLVYVGSAYNHSQFAMLVNSSIKTPDDLKGKLLGTDKPGTTVDYNARQLLQLMNLSLNDVQQRPLGTTDILLPALLSGQVAAVPLSVPQSFTAEAGGYHILKDSYDQPYQSVGVVTSRTRIDELTPALLRFFPAYRQGMQAFNQQPDLAKKLIGQYTKTTDQTVIDKSYDFYKNQTPFQEDLQPTVEGIQKMADFLGDTIVPSAKGVKAEQFIDRRVLNQLKF